MMLKSSDLDNERVCIGGLGLRWHMLLDSLTWPSHRQQNESVREEDDSAGQRVAKDEKADDVRQSWKLVVGRMPVNAAGCAVRFRTVMSPLCQGPYSKHRCITPHSNHQEAGMGRGELVTWSDRRQKKGLYAVVVVISILKRHSSWGVIYSPWLGKQTLRQHTKERAVRLVKLHRPNSTPHIA